MEITKSSLNYIYDVSIYDYAYGKLEILRTYILVLTRKNRDEVLKKVESLEDVQEFEAYIEDKKNNVKYLCNFDPLNSDEYIYKYVFQDRDEEFIPLVLAENRFEELEARFTKEEVLPEFNDEEIPF